MLGLNCWFLLRAMGGLRRPLFLKPTCGRELGAVVVTTAVLYDYRLSNLEKGESEIVVDLGRLLEDAANAQDMREWAVGM